MAELKPIELSKTKLLSLHKKEAIRLYEDANFLIIFPTTYNSMKAYGYGTTWCVTSDDENIYESFSENPMFVIIIKGQMKGAYQEKYLLQFETHGIVDINTEDVSYDDFFETYPQLIPVLKKLITEDTAKTYSEFEKDYFGNIILRERASKTTHQKDSL